MIILKKERSVVAWESNLREGVKMVMAKKQIKGQS